MQTLVIALVVAHFVPVVVIAAAFFRPESYVGRRRRRWSW